MTEVAWWEEPMVKSARKWIAEALAGWAEEDYGKVVTLAPIAVEHLTKAALWDRNPVLLAILDKGHEKSFLALAVDPELTDSNLRTVGLSEALTRIASVYKAASPLDSIRRKRLIDARGGAIHAGQFTPQTARHVLDDALTLFIWLADLTDRNPKILFGIHSETAERLLDQRRSDKQRSVDQRIAAARGHMMRLANSVGGALLHDTIAQKEALTSDVLPRIIQMVSVGSKSKCPACHQNGMLLGELEIDPLVDVEGTSDGVVYNVGLDYYLIPDSFYCHVCGLTLQDTEELAFAELPHERFLLSSDEITDELLDYARAQEEWMREIADDQYDGSDSDY